MPRSPAAAPAQRMGLVAPFTCRLRNKEFVRLHISYMQSCPCKAGAAQLHGLTKTSCTLACLAHGARPVSDLVWSKLIREEKKSRLETGRGTHTVIRETRARHWVKEEGEGTYFALWCDLHRTRSTFCGISDSLPAAKAAQLPTFCALRAAGSLVSATPCQLQYSWQSNSLSVTAALCTCRA